MGRLVRGHLDQLKLNEESGVRPDHGRASSISPSMSSSGSGNGRSIDRLVGRLILRRKLPGEEGVVTRGLEQRADFRRKVRVHQALDFLMAQKARTHDSTKLT